MCSLRASLVAEQKRIRLPRQDTWFNPWVEKIPEEGNGNPLQYSCLEKSRGQRNLADRGTWRATSMGSQRIDHSLATKQQKCVFIFHIYESCPQRTVFTGVAASQEQ